MITTGLVGATCTVRVRHRVYRGIIRTITHAPITGRKRYLVYIIESGQNRVVKPHHVTVTGWPVLQARDRHHLGRLIDFYG